MTATKGDGILLSFFLKIFQYLFLYSPGMIKLILKISTVKYQNLKNEPKTKNYSIGKNIRLD